MIDIRMQAFLIVVLACLASSCISCDRRDPRTGRGPIPQALDNDKTPLTAAPTMPPKDPLAQSDDLSGGKMVFSDNFNRSALGDEWTMRHNGWRIQDGVVIAPPSQNKGLWLNRELPEKVRIEFTAWSESTTGDIKCEVFARERLHEEGYSLIMGGWQNTISIIGRWGEHSQDRIERRDRKVEPQRRYFWQIIRTNNIVRWYIDGEYFMSYPDPQPIDGLYFGFNNWEAPVRYDDLAIYDLGEE